MSWTDEKVAKLKSLWGKGNTASEIAEILGGVSRNAVIGKAHRLNLSAKIKTRSVISNNINGTLTSNNNLKKYSVIDLLFNQGNNSKDVLLTNVKKNK